MIPITWKEFERVLLNAGCHFDRQVGDHRIYKRDDLKRPIVIPADNAIPVFIIRNNLRTLGISREEYFELLQKHQTTGPWSVVQIHSLPLLISKIRNVAEFKWF